jgi:hypothetical protein
MPSNAINDEGETRNGIELMQEYPDTPELMMR